MMQFGKLEQFYSRGLSLGLVALSALVLGIVLARLFWMLAAPASPFAPPATALSSPTDSARLFGVAAASSAAPSGTLSNMQLIGIFAPRNGQQGFAVLKLDGTRQIGVALGENVAPGVKLAEIYPDYVLLEQGGVRQKLILTGIESRLPTNAIVAQSAVQQAAP